jgi:uncharacterized membrane protein YfcA
MSESLSELFNIPDAYLTGPLLLCALIALGFTAGTLSGLFGVGGAFLITPLLNAVFGIPYPFAVGSGLCYTIGTSVTGTARHGRLGNVEVKSTLILGGGAIVGAVLGAMLNQFLERSLGAYRYDLTMDVLFMILLTLTGFMVLRGNTGDEPGLSVLQRLRIPPHIDLPGAGLAHVSVTGILAVGLGIGVLTGMLGIGGGVLLVPVLILVVGLTPHLAVGTSLGVVFFSSMSGTIKYGLAGRSSLGVAMALLVGSTLGVQLGAWICHKLHATRLRRYFAVLVFAVAVGIAVKFARSLLTH